MHLLTNRRWFTNKSTIGELYIGSSGFDVTVNAKVDKPFSFTLEPPKEPITYPEFPTISYRCIPAGTYKVTRRYSPHFKMDVLTVNNVPGRSDIEIHFGNFAEPHSIANIQRPPDTEGCLLVAYDRSKIVPDFIGSSKPAFHALNDIVFPVLESGEEVWITYVENPEVETPVLKSPKVIEVDEA